MPEWAHVAISIFSIACSIGTLVFVTLSLIELRKQEQIRKQIDKDKTH